MRLLESYLPFLIPFFYFCIAIILSIEEKVQLLPIFKSILPFANWLTTDFYESLYDKGGILITVSAVFIGIYFTIFSLLGNIREDSSINLLSENHFKKLLNYIFLAFLSSFGYLLLSLFIQRDNEVLFIRITLLILLTYMFYSAFRFGIIMFYSYRKDFQNYKLRIKKQKQEELELRNSIKKIEKFIVEINRERQIEKNKELKK